MPGTSRVFVAQLTGLPVFGPDGEQIGKVRDLVAGLRVGSQPPRVLGIVVELITRRRIFVPALRVTTIEPNAVTLSTGSVNLRAFHQRPNEVLVLGQLLDARVQVAASGAAAVVVDAGMELTRTRDWLLTKLAIRSRTGRLSRRGPVEVLRYAELTGLGLLELERTPQDASALLAVYDTMRAADVD
ncbi:MAG: magnesium transporter, partial [Sciscionella sp.]